MAVLFINKILLLTNFKKIALRVNMMSIQAVIKCNCLQIFFGVFLYNAIQQKIKITQGVKNPPIFLRLFIEDYLKLRIKGLDILFHGDDVLLVGHMV